MSNAQLKAQIEMLQMKMQKLENQINMQKVIGQTGKTMKKGGGSKASAKSRLSDTKTTYKRGFPADDGKMVRYGIKVEVKNFLDTSVKDVVENVKNRAVATKMADVETSQMYKDREADFVAFCDKNKSLMEECTQAMGIPLPPPANIFKYQIGRQEGIKKVINTNAAKVAAAALAAAALAAKV